MPFKMRAGADRFTRSQPIDSRQRGHRALGQQLSNVASGTLVCPTYDNTLYIPQPNGHEFVIECYYDRYGGDERNGTVYTTTFDSCIKSCDTDPTCVAVSYVPNAQAGSSGPCYLKNVLNQNVVVRQTVWGARRLDAPMISMPLPDVPTTPSVNPHLAGPSTSSGNALPFVGPGSFPGNDLSVPPTIAVVSESSSSPNPDAGNLHWITASSPSTSGHDCTTTRATR